jgi:hypothetical protein
VPTTFSLPDPDVTELLAEQMLLHHPRLRKAGVKVGVLLANNPDGPALKRQGYPVLAMVKVVALRDRLTKGYDAELQIDLHAWGELTPAAQAACLDHELSHLDLCDVPASQLRAVQADDPDAPTWRLDDLGRPKLRSVPGDWASSDGFRSVCERHGRAAVEMLSLERCYTIARNAVGGGR